MKKSIVIASLLASSALAGPLKIATYPARHFVRTQKALFSPKGHSVAHGMFKAFKAVLW